MFQHRGKSSFKTKFATLFYIVICEEYINFQVSNSNEDPGKQKGEGGGRHLNSDQPPQPVKENHHNIASFPFCLRNSFPPLNL